MSLDEKKLHEEELRDEKRKAEAEEEVNRDNSRLAVMPPLVKHAFTIISIIGIRELTQNGKIIAANAASMVMSVWLVVALFYLVVCTILAKFAKIVERKIAYGRK